MIKSKIENELKKIVKEPIEIEIFIPENEQFGHYSSNVALKLATLARKKSRLKRGITRKESNRNSKRNKNCAILIG